MFVYNHDSFPLRLRQICNHPGLVQSILADEETGLDGMEGDADLVSAMEGLELANSAGGGREVGTANSLHFILVALCELPLVTGGCHLEHGESCI